MNCKLSLAFLLSTTLLASLTAGCASPPRPSVAAVPTAPDKVDPLGVGAVVPRVQVRTMQGKALNLDTAISKKPTILIFYRGGW